MRTYEDFELWISAEGEGFRVKTTGAGKSQGVTLDAAALRERTRGLGEAFEGREALQPAGLREAKSLGSTLFEAIFPRSIFSRWREVRTRWGLKKRDLRLRLHFERAGALAPLPWELLYDGERFLCLSAETPIVHHPEFSGSVQDCADAPPLRVLLVLPEPLRQPDLDVYGEFLAIQEELAPAIRNGLVVVEILERPSFQGLMERLKVEPPVHALHFAGHGEVLPEFGDGRLWFQQDGRIRNADPIPGFALAPMLNDAKVRFVFINACEGGGSASIENPENLAYRLLEAGIPAVLALRSPIGNQAAKKFARAFYHLLAKGCPLEESVAAGRQALQTGAFGLAWASPVLYLRAPSGQLIRPKSWIYRALLLASILIAAILGIAFAAREGERIFKSLARKTPPSTLVNLASEPDCPSPPGLDFAFVKIEPESFEMGAPFGLGDRTEERPAHWVTLTHSFCVGAFEVTAEQWSAVLAGRNAQTRPGIDLPHVRVSWNDTQGFLARLNERDPKGNYRLLTEAEHEYSTRAGSSSDYFFGVFSKDLPTYGNCIGDDGFPKLAPIGSFEANPWGLYDVHGNVQEWVGDWYEDYSDALEGAVDPLGPETGEDRVRRGGSFIMNPTNCASWSRGHSAPDNRSKEIGFRIARSPVENQAQ